jgi:hypothetical protein
LLCVQIKEDERKERQEQERVKREQKRAADKARREAAAAEAALNRYVTDTLPIRVLKELYRISSTF